MRTKHDQLKGVATHLGYSQAEIEKMIGALGDDTVIRAAADSHIKSLSAAAAADPRTRVLVESVLAQARSLGIELDPNKVVDPYELSNRLRDKGVGVPARMRLKTALAQIGAM
jgi:hypothetical protein